ncbi:hypothetical protein DFH09DRAFT_1274969 [Mycena vulgaris]|nr:hypothetical protein DFH09DRAFT_1274969 [Mycena vulgaris]
MSVLCEAAQFIKTWSESDGLRGGPFREVVSDGVEFARDVEEMYRMATAFVSDRSIQLLEHIQIHGHPAIRFPPIITPKDNQQFWLQRTRLEGQTFHQYCGIHSVIPFTTCAREPTWIHRLGHRRGKLVLRPVAQGVADARARIGHAIPRTGAVDEDDGFVVVNDLLVVAAPRKEPVASGAAVDALGEGVFVENGTEPVQSLGRLGILVVGMSQE